MKRKTVCIGGVNMNKYVFFIYDYYYPRGGLEDLLFSFDDIDEAKAILNQVIKDEGDDMYRLQSSRILQIANLGTLEYRKLELDYDEVPYEIYEKDYPNILKQYVCTILNWIKSVVDDWEVQSNITINL